MARRARGEIVDPGTPPGDPGGDEDDTPDRGDLEDLTDPRYADWAWQVYRIRSLEEMARVKTRLQRVWVLTIQGPLNKSALREAVGGGVFEAWGYIAGERGVRERHLFELEGPPRTYDPPAPPASPITAAAPAPTTPASPNGSDPVLLAMIQNQQKTLDAIMARLAAPAAAPGLSFTDALAMAELMGRGGRGGGGADMKELVAVLQQGIEIGGNAVGGNEKSTLEVILEKGLPALERVAAAMASRARVRPVSPPPARKHEPSSAAVVEDPATPPPWPAPAPELTPDQQAAAVRWGGAVDALARAIADNTDAADFADTLDALLLPDEIELMLAGGTASVMEQIRTAGDRYPILTTPAAEQFVGAVLASLAEPAEPTL
jgi:hypothetical protein